MPAPQEVSVASHEDTTHEWKRQVTNLGLTQNRRPSSQAPRGAGMGHTAT